MQLAVTAETQMAVTAVMLTTMEEMQQQVPVDQASAAMADLELAETQQQVTVDLELAETQ
jgi:hypothetical protein